jgi:hypothetical protein
VPLLTEIVILVVLADEGGGGLRANSSDSKDSGLCYLGSRNKNLIKGSFIHSFLSYLLFHAFPSPVTYIYATVLPPLLPFLLPCFKSWQKSTSFKIQIEQYPWLNSQNTRKYKICKAAG